MTDTEITYRTCKHCDGLGEVDPTDIVDENDLDAVRKELMETVLDGGAYGIFGELRGHRIHMASRVIWLANRIVWLENLVNLRAEEEADTAARWRRRRAIEWFEREVGFLTNDGSAFAETLDRVQSEAEQILGCPVEDLSSASVEQIERAAQHIADAMKEN